MAQQPGNPTAGCLADCVRDNQGSYDLDLQAQGRNWPQSDSLRHEQPGLEGFDWTASLLLRYVKNCAPL
jgi:hypothetical protein